MLEGLKIKYGVIFNHKKVARIMKKYNLKPEYIRRIRPNVNAKRIEDNVQPNLVKRQFKTKDFKQIWCTDSINFKIKVYKNYKILLLNFFS